MNTEEKREYDRVRMAKWLEKHPEARERNRLRNAKWRKENPQGYLQAAARYRHENPDKLKEYRLKTRFGLTLEDYNKMMALQNNCCAICGEEETARHNFSNNTQRLAVDHCHVTGKIRGLLCMDCNRGLGKFHDDPNRIEKAIEYLKRHAI